MSATQNSDDIRKARQSSNNFLGQLHARAKSATEKILEFKPRTTNSFEESTASDVISDGIRDEDAKLIDRRRLRTIWWMCCILLTLVVATSMILLALLALPATSMQSTTIENRVTEVSNKVANVTNQVVDVTNEVNSVNQKLDVLIAVGNHSALSVEEWGTGSFVEGLADCPADSSVDAPCGVTGFPGGSKRSLRNALMDTAAGPALVLIVGGHDRKPLSPAAQKKFGTNIQLAQARADAVRTAIENSLSREKTPALRYISIPRAAAKLDSSADADRVVTVSVFRVGDK